MSRRSRPQYRLGLEWISGVAFPDTLTRPIRLTQGFTSVRCCCRFRFQDETHDLLKNSGLEKISLSPISVSIETISANFRFQLRLIDRSIDLTIIDMAGLIDDPNDPRWQEAERRDQFLRELLKATGWRATRDVVDAARMTFGVSRSALEREAVFA